MADGNDGASRGARKRAVDEEAVAEIGRAGRDHLHGGLSTRLRRWATDGNGPRRRAHVRPGRETRGAHLAGCAPLSGRDDHAASPKRRRAQMHDMDRFSRREVARVGCVAGRGLARRPRDEARGEQRQAATVEEAAQRRQQRADEPNRPRDAVLPESA